MSSATHALTSLSTLLVRQKREMAELIGFETRNKYSIETPEGMAVLFAAEQQKGVLGFLLRQFVGHWRSFEIHIFDSQRQPYLIAEHPFRFLFQRLEVRNTEGKKIGAIQKRFSVLSKKFDVEGAHGEVLMSVSSPLLKIWTFPFLKNGGEVAVVTKQWRGVLAEGFTDADTFAVKFGTESLSLEERQLIVAASIFIDLQYFENKAQ